MPKSVTFNRGLSSVLFWSVISAAFIGPGTVTTASNAGATFGLDLLWALVFSIFATIILQEAAARVTIASGMNLGEILARRYERNSRWVRWILFGTIVFGCAAYQAGNILGAISGLGLFSEIPRQWLTLVLCLLAAVLLWWGNTAWITRILGAAVALMGIAFIWSAFSGNLGFGAWLEGMRPRVNNGNALLVIGLIGTTIVPYNLFLASGISKGQRIQEMRWGVVIAIIIGGIISAAIMAVGTQVNGPFSFTALSQAMELKMGASGTVLFGFGLFAAGLSSAITSPFAAAITGQSLLGSGRGAWSSKGKYFRLTWAGVISAGLILGTLDVKPVPAIILAQAVNGVLLPVVAVFLTLAVNDRQLIPREFLNTTLVNALTLLIVLIASFLGLNNLWRAVVQVIPQWNAHPNWGWMTAGAGSLIILFWLGRQIFKQ
ncbi:MAG: divalent metal cation transporter [Lewinellaceae bacterium]|nr:divalent metal cation transporter [Lewinellaceae bacterium]